MKMVKSLLLGSAAGILAVAGAQAADLPVKAKPVEYVKVCSLYGAGFYYIPGTDTCIKIGGFMRAEYGFNATHSHGQYWEGAQAAYNRYENQFTTRSRFNYTFDVRTQTEYGTLRGYIRAGLQYTTGDGDNGAVYYDRQFIQLGGFTFGKTVSFFDFLSGGGYSITSLFGGSDTGNGTNVAAYTAQFGNGFSGTIAIEDATYRRQPGILSATTGLPAIGATANMTNYGGQNMPDFVGNLRVDQAWGSAQFMAALHQVRATYYNPALEGSGAPDDKWGFAIGGGVQIKLPWAAGDTVSMHVTYAEGANKYNQVGNGGGQLYGIYDGTSAFEGLVYDAVYGATAGDLQLTKTFGLNAGIEHYWTPMLRTAVFGSYIKTDFNDAASTIICTAYSATPAAGCNPDWTAFQIGSKTVWNPVKNLDVNLEVLYTKFESDHAAGVTRTSAATSAAGKPAIAYTMSDQDVFSGVIRIQRNFWP